jgi:hemerythrin superfamily protein
MDAIRMLKDDHKSVNALFKRFEKAGERAFTEKRSIVDQIIEELSKHAAVEEQLFYPVARATVPDTDDVTLESLEEHHVVKWVLSELESMDPQDERFDAKVTVLIELVRHHVEEEEGEFFPKVRDELGRAALTDLGDVMAAAKSVAPTHPHPRSPDEPPANLLVGTAAGMVDRISDTMSGVAQGGVTALNDLVARILGRKRPSSSPTGPKAARRTAQRVRSKAASVTDEAIEAVSDAKRQGQRATSRRNGSAPAKRAARSVSGRAKSTARTAKSGAKATATTAKKSTKRVATTAKRATTTTARAARGGTTRTATKATRATKRSTRPTSKRGSR